MKAFKRLMAVTEILLVLPACLFMSALTVRSLPLLPYQAAQTAQWIVMWYAARMWSLWVLLIALPLAALVTGCAILLHGWKEEAEMRQQARLPFRAIWEHKATLAVAATTLTAGVILAIVILHMLMN